jgi:hypothetical protein
MPVGRTDVQALLLGSMGGLEVFYENSKPFFEFLKNQGLDELLGKARLRLRKKHSVVPHVCGFMPCAFATYLIDFQTMHSAS